MVYEEKCCVLASLDLFCCSLLLSYLVALFSIPPIYSLSSVSICYPSFTHCLFTQASSDPYNPVIIGPVPLPSSHSCFHLIPSLFLCQRVLWNPQILFSLIFFAFPQTPQCPSSSCSVFPEGENSF